MVWYRFKIVSFFLWKLTLDIYCSFQSSGSLASNVSRASSRHLYRKGSQSSLSLHSLEGGIPLQAIGDGTANGAIGRKRTPSGKSIRSRKVSTAEYHLDLKSDLSQVSWRLTCPPPPTHPIHTDTPNPFPRINGLHDEIWVNHVRYARSILLGSWWLEECKSCSQKTIKTNLIYNVTKVFVHICSCVDVKNKIWQ